jgi:hypothetical protein
MLAGRERLSNYVLTVGVLTFGLLALRAYLTLSHEGFLGVDGGAYLLHAKRLIGLDLPQIDFTRPALAPGWMLVPFIQVLGDDAGIALWQAIASTIPIIPAAALLAYRVLSPKLALVATIFVALNPWHWEMVVTGALPLVGIGLILVVVWGLLRVSTGVSKWWDKAAVFGAVGLIPYINQTSTGLAAVAIPTFLLALCFFNWSWRPLLRSIPWLLLGVALALPAVILWYSDVAPGGDRMTFPGPKVFIPIGYTAAWLVVAYGFVLGIPALRRSHNVGLKALTVLMLTHAMLTLFSSYDESVINIFFRSQHIATPLLMIVGTWTVASVLRGKRLSGRTVTIGIASFAIGLMVVSGWAYQRQAYYSDMATPDMLAAMDQIPNDGSTILTTNFMTGLWVAAIQRQPTAWAFSADPPPMWQGQYSKTQCILGWKGDCDPVQAAKDIDVRYVLMDTKFPHITDRAPNLWGAPEDTWAPTEQAPWLSLKYSQGTVRLWEVRPQESWPTV